MVCCLSCSNPSKPLCICTFFVGVGLVQGDEAMPERLRNGEGDTLGEFLTSQTSDSSLDNRQAPQASCSLDDHCKMLTLVAASKRTFVFLCFFHKFEFDAPKIFLRWLVEDIPEHKWANPTTGDNGSLFKHRHHLHYHYHDNVDRMDSWNKI